MFPKMTESYLPTTVAAIAAFERDHDLVLPPLYREFLLATNGGPPEKTVFPVQGMPNNPDNIVQGFFGIGVPYHTNELAYPVDLYAGGIPHGVLPIAGNGGGDYLCLDLRAGTDRVAFWDKRHFWGTGEWRESDLYPVANSFAEFLAALRPDDE